MSIRFVILEADSPSDYAEFHKALDKVRAGTDQQVNAPQALPQQVDTGTDGEAVADFMAQLAAAQNGQQVEQVSLPQAPVPVAAFALPQQQAAHENKGVGKRSDGLGMKGHKLDCQCPADGAIKRKLSTLFGQPIAMVPAEGTPEAAAWGKALADSEGPKPIPTPAPVPAAPAQQLPDVSAQLAQLSAQQAPVPQVAAAPSLPQQLQQYPSNVYQVVLAWATEQAPKYTAPKQEAILTFIKGGRTLDSLQDIKHKNGTLYDTIVGLIRKAMAA